MLMSKFRIVDARLSLLHAPKCNIKSKTPSKWHQNAVFAILDFCEVLRLVPYFADDVSRPEALLVMKMQSTSRKTSEIAGQ